MPALGLHTVLPEQSRAVVDRKELMRIKGHSKSPRSGFHTQRAESPNSDAPAHPLRHHQAEKRRAKERGTNPILLRKISTNCDHFEQAAPGFYLDRRQ